MAKKTFTDLGMINADKSYQSISYKQTPFGLQDRVQIILIKRQP